MSTEVKLFRGLYGDEHSPVIPHFVHYEKIQTRSVLYDWEIKEHLHPELYQLFVIDKGGGELRTESQHIRLQGPCVVVVPSNNLHGFVFSPDVQGEVITCSESFLENLFRENPQVWHELSRVLVVPFSHDPEWQSQIKQHTAAIEKELLESNTEKQTVIQLLFKLLMLQLYRNSLTNKQEAPTGSQRNLRYFRAFLKSVRSSVTQLRPVQAYAHELGITTVHLNRICQSIAQKSALQIMHEHLLVEAKKYLTYTSYSIAEVSYLLNFSEPAYFTKFFKKQTGVAPSEFKKI